MIDVSIVVLTFNNLRYTQRLVESVQAKAGDIPYEFVFVDSGSTDGTLDSLAALRNAKVIDASDEMFVFNRNLNRGIMASEGHTIICANNDVEVISDHFLASIVKTLWENPIVGVLGVELGEPRQDDRKLVLLGGYTEGCFYAMRRKVWEELGGLSEHYTGYGCEEADLSVRLLKKGYRTGFLQGLFCHHVGSATFRLGYAPPEACEKNALVFQQLHGYDLNFVEGCDFWINLHGYLECVFGFEWQKQITKLSLGCNSDMSYEYVRIAPLPAPGVDLTWNLNEGVPYPDCTVDEVWENDVLTNAPKPFRMMNEIYRVLKPNGTLHSISPCIDGCEIAPEAIDGCLWSDSVEAERRERLGIQCRFQIEHTETIHVDKIPCSITKYRAIK